jgi:predicted GNAT family acetyltransferase
MAILNEPRREGSADHPSCLLQPGHNDGIIELKENFHLPGGCMPQPEPIVIHNPEAGRFEIRKDDHLAVLEYHLSDGKIVFTHTGVPEALGGQGIGSLLARAGLDYARTQSFTIEPLCSFIAGYIQKHPEYQNLVK